MLTPNRQLLHKGGRGRGRVGTMKGMAAKVKRKSKKQPAANPRFRDRIKDFRRVPASCLIGAPWNWRIHPSTQRKAMADSIEELGFYDPLDVRELPDGSLEIIDGHLRQDIIDGDIGPDTLIPVIVTDFTEEEAKKANLTKDPLAALATADKDRLDALLREVQTGSDALAGMLTELAAKSGVIQPEPPSDFSTVDESLKTDHVCPKCGYQFSGGQTALPSTADGRDS